MIREKNSFLGIGWQFPPEFPDDGKSVAMVQELTDVRQSLEVLFQTAKFSRLMHPEFYCDLHEFVFSNDNEQTRANIANAIEQSILINEARVDYVGAEFLSDPLKPGVLYIEVEYIVRSTNSRQNMVFPFYLNEGRDPGIPSAEAV